MENRGILESWKEISAHLKRNIRTCRRWECELGLPIHRLDGTPKARVYAYTVELDSWLEEKLKPDQAQAVDQKPKTGNSLKRYWIPAPGILAVAAVAVLAVSGSLLWRHVLRTSTAAAPQGGPSSGFIAAPGAWRIEDEAGPVTTSSAEARELYFEGRKDMEWLDYERALSYLQRALQKDPQFAMAYSALGTACSCMGVELRRTYVRRALDLSRGLPANEGWLIEGQSLIQDEDYARAIETLERLVKAYPNHMLGHRYLALAYLKAGDLDKAFEHHELVARVERTAEAVADLSQTYMAKGLYVEQESLCLSFLREHEDNRDIRYELVQSYLCRRRFDLALAEAEKLHGLPPAPTTIGLTWKHPKGRVLFCMGDFDGADPILLEPWWRVGLYAARGKFKEGVAYAERRAKECRGDKAKEAESYLFLSTALEKAGLYRGATQAFSQYLALSEECRRSTDDPEMVYLPSARKGDLYAAGRLQAEMGDFDDAEATAEELKSLIDKGINTKELRHYESILGLVEFEKKNYGSAAELFGRARSRLEFEQEWTVDQAPFYYDLARALYASGDLDKASLAYQELTLLTVGRYLHGDLYARAYYMLGKIAEIRGDRMRADENFRKFLDIWKDADPGLPEIADAKTALAGLDRNLNLP